MKAAEIISDKDALLDRLSTGKPLDPEIYRRIRDRQESLTEELRKKYGEMAIAVDLIREVREET